MDFKAAVDSTQARPVVRDEADTPTNIADTLDSVVYPIRAELPTLEYRGKPTFEAARARCGGTPRSTFSKSQILRLSVVVLFLRPHASVPGSGEPVANRNLHLATDARNKFSNRNQRSLEQPPQAAIPLFRSKRLNDVAANEIGDLRPQSYWRRTSLAILTFQLSQ